LCIHFLERIPKAARSIQEIIRNVGEFQALEAGSMEMKLEAVDPNQVMQRVNFDFEEKLPERHDLYFKAARGLSGGRQTSRSGASFKGQKEHSA
jgi:hypothetical protein